MIFLGTLFNRKDEKYIRKKSAKGIIQNQANTFQWNCIDGFLDNKVDSLSIINVLPVGIYPLEYRKLFLQNVCWEYRGCKCNEIGTINLPFLKQHFRYRKVLTRLKNSTDKRIVIYSTYLPFLKAISKLNQSYEITLIVTDLPDYYDSSKVSLLKSKLRSLNNKKIYRCLKRVDKFVLLTEQMKDRLCVGDRPYVIVEGISGETNTNYLKNNTIKRITYTGSLDEKFGMLNLLNAFSNIKREDIELFICGAGDCEQLIRNNALIDHRIHFLGYVSKEEADSIVFSSSLLINPRQNNSEYTKYSFPSKTMEYFMSGIPVVMYKLDGVPVEYYNYCFYPESDSVESLIYTINYALNLKYDDLMEFGIRAKMFVLENKNRIAQAKKILDLIES